MSDSPQRATVIGIKIWLIDGMLAWEGSAPRTVLHACMPLEAVHTIMRDEETNPRHRQYNIGRGPAVRLRKEFT